MRCVMWFPTAPTRPPPQEISVLLPIPAYKPEELPGRFASSALRHLQERERERETNSEVFVGGGGRDGGQ
jgi:hypothetical protein